MSLISHAKYMLVFFTPSVFCCMAINELLMLFHANKGYVMLCYVISACKAGMLDVT